MRNHIWHGTILTILAIVFAVALTFGSVELPRLLNRSLELIFGDALSPQGIWSGPNENSSELYIQKHFLRPIGYASLIVGVALLEETKMQHERRDEYAAYAARTDGPVPLLGVPVPKGKDHGPQNYESRSSYNSCLFLAAFILIKNIKKAKGEEII